MNSAGGCHPAGRELAPRRMVGRAAAAMVSQVCTAGSSLVLQLIAAHTLGLAGYGAFALCLSLLTSATALYTGYVGDGLTVLDRFDARLRSGIGSSAVLLLAVCGALAIGLVLILHLGGVFVAVVYAVMVLGWLVEETGRRILMARLEFWGLVVNDAVYGVVSLAAVAAVVVTGHHLSLLSLLACMAAGALAAILTAVVQLPGTEFERLHLGRTELRAVASFSVWRALQASLRPAQLLSARVMLLQLISLSTVGAVEAGRLVVAPIQSVINGAGGFLLSTSAYSERHPELSSRRLAERATALLVLLTLVGGAGAAALSHPLGKLMAGRPVPATLVLGWTLYLVTWAATLPYVTELVARRRTRAVFNIRLADTLVGVAAMLVGLLGGVDPVWTPWLLSTGGVLSAWLTRRLALRTRDDSGNLAGANAQSSA